MSMRTTKADIILLRLWMGVPIQDHVASWIRVKIIYNRLLLERRRRRVRQWMNGEVR